MEIASRHLFFGIRNTHVLERRRGASSEDAVDVTLRGELEGRALLLHGHTVRGHRCLYDLVLFAAPEDYADVEADFEVLVRGFRRLKDETR